MLSSVMERYRREAPVWHRRWHRFGLSEALSSGDRVNPHHPRRDSNRRKTPAGAPRAAIKDFVAEPGSGVMKNDHLRAGQFPLQIVKLVPKPDDGDDWHLVTKRVAAKIFLERKHIRIVA
jgi:hypothetical protein